MIDHKLKIQGYEVMVHLGTSEEERKYLQPVRFDFEIQYDHNVQGAHTDMLNEATDYVELAGIIKKTSKKKKYQLIEHLNQQVFEALLDYLRIQGVMGQMTLSVNKIKVPVENLKNGVVFTCSTKL